MNKCVNYKTEDCDNANTCPYWMYSETSVASPKLSKTAEEIQDKLAKHKTISFTQDEVSSINKKLKGYIFDSLVYRYQLALERGVKARAEEFKNKNYSDPIVQAKEANKRDLLRFCQILDEVIGKHD